MYIHVSSVMLAQERERGKHYISSSHLGLIRCLALIRARISHTHPNDDPVLLRLDGDWASLA